MQGIVFDIKRYAVHDGPGIRTTVFFKGCPLNCWWCHNPESQKAGKQKVCRINRIEDVSVKQFVPLGESYSVDQLLHEIEKDFLFYEESGGGVTFSGGEPLMQSGFLKEILIACKKADIHTTLDTSGFASQNVINDIMENVDLFLYDIKHMEEGAHEKFTGVSNKQILSNLQFLVKNGKQVIVRFPMIPGVNDDLCHVAMMKAYLREIPGIKEVHILPYHRIGKDKYERFGMVNKMPDIDDLLPQDTVWVKEELEKAGITVRIPQLM